MHLIEQHPCISSIGGYMIFNAFVAGMPAPPPGARVWYRWLHTSLNALAINIGELVRARYPSTPQLSLSTRIETSASAIQLPTPGPSDAGDTGAGNTPSS